MPNVNHRPENVREHLARHGLFVNEPEPVIICRTCRFALGDSPTAVANHLAEKHNVPKSTTKELRRLLRPYTFLGPEALRLRPDGSTPHPHLQVQPGISCRHCSLKTTSHEVLSRHLSKNHGVKRKPPTWLHDHVVSGLSLQSWGWHSAAGYWIVKPESSIALALDGSLFEDSVPRLSRSSVDCGPSKRRRTASPPKHVEHPPVRDHHTLLQRSKHKTGHGPWATETEAAFYRTAPRIFWSGSLPIFGRPSPLERDNVLEERKLISAHIKSQEAEANKDFDTPHRLHGIEGAFVRWRNVGCQLCYASTGEPEPDHDLEHCRRRDASDKARKIFNWLQDLNLPRLVPGIGACSLCSMTDFPCEDVIAGISSDEAACDEVKKHRANLLKGSPFGDGECQNKPVVKRTIAALCAYDDQILGKYLSERLRDENDMDFMAQNLVAFWFERRVSFRDNSVLRLLFVFELLTSAFDFRRSVSAAAKEPRKIEDLPCLHEQGWDDDDELQGWQNTMKWWVGKCGFCAGRGLSGSKINHTLGECSRGGAEQRSLRIGEAIFGEGIEAQGGCRRCGIPREFCDRWKKSSDGHWQVRPSIQCQYGHLAYEIVVGLFQCSDTRYALDLLTTIEEEGEEEYSSLGDEEVSRWLCKRLVVSGVEGAELMRQLWVWTQMVHKAYVNNS